jgi:DNA gyrase subunit B
MPAENSSRTPTRFPAACTAWASRRQRAVEWLDLRIWRDGKEHYMRFREDGDPVAPLKIVAMRRQRRQRGTEVTFLPSTKTFTKTEFDYATLEHRLRELAFLNSGVTIVLTDLRGVEKKETTLHYEGGLKPSCAISTAPRRR